MTETSGAGTYSASFFARPSRSCMGVRPLSFRRGSEILPSGRTGTVRLIVVLFHTPISRTSSGPILYSPSISTAPGRPLGGPCAAGEPGDHQRNDDSSGDDTSAQFLLML